MLQDDKIKHTPALALPLTGRHLIEASAGTGKTWTLTGVVLRLIIEAGYPCEKIIATTFTKSASADMKQRIRERLQSFYQLLNVAMAVSDDNSLSNFDVFSKIDTNNNNQQEKTQKLADIMQKIEKTAKQHKKQSHFDDFVNQYLLQHILQQMLRMTKNDKKLDFYIAKQRTQMALSQLDKLFVSTLDSLCQKWLREFSSDTNFSADMKISNDYMRYVEQMVHDQFRGFLSYLWKKYGNVPALYDFVQHKIDKPVSYLPVVERALNFYSAPIDVLNLEDIKFDVDFFEGLVKSIVNFDDAEFEKYFNPEYRQSVNMAKRFLHNHFAKIKDIQQNLANKDALTWLLNDITADELKLLEAIADCVTTGAGFNKEGETQREHFLQFDIIQNLFQLGLLRKQINDATENLTAYFSQFIANYVRTNLPKLLNARGLTTFSLLLAQLNQALAGKQGKMLVKHIRHEYPVALIDESQDINTEQALLIQRLYLQDSSGRINTHQGFLLLVGDPKQAIYGFRGGDVYNYTTLKNLFPEKPYQLTDNFRSSKDLVDSLNQWYGVADDDVANDNPNPPNLLGEEISYQQVKANREQSYLCDKKNLNENLPTLYQLKAHYKQAYSDNAQEEDIDHVDFTDIIVAQIGLWFEKSTLQFCQTLDNGEKLARELSLEDICILSTKNRYLNEIEKRLNQHGIATLRGGNKSIFADTMSQDMLKLMTVLLQPYHQAKLRTLLMSCFFQMSLEKINHVFDTEKQNNQDKKWLDNFQRLLLKASEKWQKESFLVAIQWLFQQPLDNEKTTIWQNLASHENGERWLLDLRQLCDIISEQVFHQDDKVGEYQLFDWFFEQNINQPKDEKFLQHRLSTETGVQLMTIHQSKGLEFNIVFVVGLTDNLNKIKEPYLYLYTDKKKQQGLNARRLSATALADEQDVKAMEIQSLYEEKLRLLYVALTRAKESVYLVTVGQYQQQTTSALKPFVKMLQKPRENHKSADVKEFELHERLSHVQVIDTTQKNSLSDYMNFLQKNPNHLIIKAKKNQTNNHKFSQTYLENIGKIQQKNFSATSHTSFTALLNFTQHEHLNHDIDEQDFDNMDNPFFNLIQPTQTPLRFRFEKGLVAGIFLHKVLEDLSNHQDRQTQDLNIPFDNQNPSPQRWSISIDRALRQQQMDEKYYSTAQASTYQHDKLPTSEYQMAHLELANWLFEILHTPLQAPLKKGMNTLRLIDIHSYQKQAEMGFNLALGQNFSLTALNQLFLEHGIELNLQQIDNVNFWQYLKGEIDLVYEYQNCYYIVDYKSNFLGNTFDDYQASNLKKVMNQHHYWLQASIYQVALHRFLKLRLPNYDIYQHLGAVEYLFLRGMSPMVAGYGSFVWQMPVPLLLALDELLGAKNAE